MIFSFLHHFKSKYPINLPQKLTFFGPDFATHCYPSKFWVRYIQNDVPRHARAQNFAPIGVFWIQDTFKALKWAKNAQKHQKTLFPSTLRVQIPQKSLINQLFLYELLFPYILAVCPQIFRPKFKKLDFEVIAGNQEKRITVQPEIYGTVQSGLV